MDFMVRDKNGNLIAVEVKTGESPYMPEQRSKDREMATMGGHAVGKNAQKAGVAGPVIVPTKVIRYR